MLDIIDDCNVISHRLYRENCILNKNLNTYVKDLSCSGRDLRHSMILDNTPGSYFLQPENGIPISTWIDNMEDKELDKIMNILEILSIADDVRPLIKKIVKNNNIDYMNAIEILKKDLNYSVKEKETEDNNTLNKFKLIKIKKINTGSPHFNRQKIIFNFNLNNKISKNEEIQNDNSKSVKHILNTNSQSQFQLKSIECNLDKKEAKEESPLKIILNGNNFSLTPQNHSNLKINSCNVSTPLQKKQICSSVCRLRPEEKNTGLKIKESLPNKRSNWKNNVINNTTKFCLNNLSNKEMKKQSTLIRLYGTKNEEELKEFHLTSYENYRLKSLKNKERKESVEAEQNENNQKYKTSRHISTSSKKIELGPYPRKLNPPILDGSHSISKKNLNSKFINSFSINQDNSGNFQILDSLSEHSISIREPNAKGSQKDSIQTLNQANEVRYNYILDNCSGDRKTHY